MSDSDSPKRKPIPPHSPELLAELEQNVGVPDGFFAHIIHEDDWSFIIKLHSLVEAGLAQLLLAHFNDPRLEPTISAMNIGGRIGKLSLVRELALLPAHNIKFIQKLTEIRNRLVHRISNINFSIDAYIRSLDRHQQLDLIDACGDGVIPSGNLIIGRPYEDLQLEELLRDPRKSFWWSSVFVLGNLAKSRSYHETGHKIAELERTAGIRAIEHFDALAKSTASSSPKS